MVLTIQPDVLRKYLSEEPKSWQDVLAAFDADNTIEISTDKFMRELRQFEYQGIIEFKRMPDKRGFWVLHIVLKSCNGKESNGRK